MAPDDEHTNRGGTNNDPNADPSEFISPHNSRPAQFPSARRSIFGFERWTPPDPADVRADMAAAAIRYALPSHRILFGSHLTQAQKREAIESFLELGRNVARIFGHSTPARDIADGLIDELGIKHEGDA